MKSAIGALIATQSRLIIAAAMLMTTSFLVIVDRAHAAAPIKEVVALHLGHEVDKTNKGDICTVQSEHECQAGRMNAAPGGFSFAADVAVGANGNLYIADGGNERVQEITPGGEFVLTFGSKVDQTTGGDVCTAASKDTCGPGVVGSKADEFSGPTSIVADRATHRIYVLDLSNWRIQEFSEAGEFILTFGKEVDETRDKNAGAGATEKDICTAVSKDSCRAGTRAVVGAVEPYAFSSTQLSVGMLAVGGPENLLYVANEQSVQEFAVDGVFKRAVSLAGLSGNAAIRSLAVNGNGDMYAATEAITANIATSIDRFDASGNLLLQITLRSRDPEALFFGIQSLAVDSNGRIGVVEFERNSAHVATPFGSLLDGENGRFITEFTVAPAANGSGLTFAPEDEMYVAASFEAQEVIGYRPESVAEPLTDETNTGCSSGQEHESDETYNCHLRGSVNPEGVAHTVAWFEWGETELLGNRTGEEELCKACGNQPVAVGAEIQGVRPNRQLYYRTSAYDGNVKAPEPALISFPTSAIGTRIVPPRILKTPRVLHAGASSAVLFGELNPENARTVYLFQYVATNLCKHVEGCADASSAPVEESEVYGEIGTTREVTGLQPGTTYAFALVAESESQNHAEKLAGEEPEEAEGTFTTQTAPVVRAVTGAANVTGATSATITGSAESDGAGAIYLFELGIDNGPATQYGVASSGAVAPSSSFVNEALSLGSLQSATTYAYRITVKSGYGEAVGAPATFTTQPLTSIRNGVPLAVLGVPNIAFPKEPAAVKKNCRHGYKRNRRGLCVKNGRHSKRRKVRH